MRDGAHRDCRHLERAKTAANSLSLCSPCGASPRCQRALNLLRLHASRNFELYPRLSRTKSSPALRLLTGKNHCLVICMGALRGANDEVRWLLRPRWRCTASSKGWDQAGAYELLQPIDGALNAGLVVALVGELGGELAAGVRPEGEHACCGRFACIKLLLQRRPAPGLH